MSCTLTIPDDFPGGWALKACQQAGGFLGNDVYRDLLPRLILNKKDNCSPSVTSLIGTFTSCMLNGLCLFFVLVFLFPQTMAPGSKSRTMWYYVTVGLTVFVPITYGMTYYIAQSAHAFKEKEDTTTWSMGAFVGSMSMYAVLVATGVVGLANLWWGDSSLLLMTFMILLLMPVAKTLLPVMILLLGPGCIPTLFGKSFLEFCAA